METNQSVIHNFKVGDVVNVFRIYPFNGDATPNLEKKRTLEGRALIKAILPFENMYKVQFAYRGKFEGRKYDRYIDPNQKIDQA